MFTTRRLGLTPSLLLGLAALLQAPSLQATDVEAGIVVLRTLDTETAAQITAPEDIFDPGSDALVGLEIEMHGLPLVTKAGTPSLGFGDTVVELEAGDFEPFGDEMVAVVATHLLALRARGSFVVTYNGGQNPETWDLTMILSEDPPPPGLLRLTIHPSIALCGTVGTFEHTLVTRPRQIFRRRRDGKTIVYDPGESGFLTLTGRGSWADSRDREEPLMAQIPSDFVNVPAGAVVVETDLIPNVELPPLPASSNIFLGVKCELIPLGILRGFLVRDPVLHRMLAEQLVEPATRTNRSLGGSEPGAGRNPAGPVGPGRRPGLLRSGMLGALGLTSLALLRRRRR